MANDSLKVLAYCESADVRRQISEAVAETRCEFRWMTETAELPYHANSTDVLILETGDDVAKLTQLVYEIYRAGNGQRVPWLIGIVSEEQFWRNPKLGAWTIDGHAALLALLLSDTQDIWTNLSSLFFRFLQNMGSNKEPS